MVETSLERRGSGHFLHNLLVFGRLLRRLGFDVNPGRMIDLVQALDLIEIGKREDFYHASRSLLVHRHEQIPLFDQAFDLFWRIPAEENWELNLTSLIHKNPNHPITIPPQLKLNEEGPSEKSGEAVKQDEQAIIVLLQTYDAQERLRKKDFADLTGEEIEAVKKMMQKYALHLGERRTRRKQPGNGANIDLRRTLRKSFTFGGEVLQWSRRTYKQKPRPLVIIADISGSMERYTRLLLHFIYGLAQSHNHPLEAFAFGTRLTRITRQVQQRDIATALAGVSQTIQDWAGGTRTGESLKAFNFIWGRRVLGRGAVVLIISDGWDRGDIDLLGHEMSRLQRSCHRLIWLNPLLGSASYEPLTRGMQSALPFIDDFLPVHNLASLEDLATHLSRLDKKR